MPGIFEERFDPQAKDDLSTANETLRDAVWTRLTGGGIALPGFATGIAAYLVTQPEPNPAAPVQAVQGLVSLSAMTESLPGEAGLRVRGFIEATREHLQATGALRQRCGTDTFALPKGGLLDLGGWSGSLAACANHQSTLILLVGALLLNLAWLVAVLQPYAHGPVHVTMPPRGLLWMILVSATGFVWFVVYWLLH